MRAGWAYLVSFPQAAKDFAELSRTTLTMPVLAIGGEKANGTLLGQQMKLVASNATMVVLKDTGCWKKDLKKRPKRCKISLTFAVTVPASWTFPAASSIIMCTLSGTRTKWH